jgi:hypothetical protein
LGAVSELHLRQSFDEPQAEASDRLPVPAPSAAPVFEPAAADSRLGHALTLRVSQPIALAALVATSFTAGALVVGAAGRRRRTPTRRERRAATARPSGGPRIVNVLGTRSLLVDVHLLGRD